MDGKANAGEIKRAKAAVRALGRYGNGRAAAYFASATAALNIILIWAGGFFFPLSAYFPRALVRPELLSDNVGAFVGLAAVCLAVAVLLFASAILSKRRFFFSAVNLAVIFSDAVLCLAFAIKKIIGGASAVYEIFCLVYHVPALYFAIAAVAGGAKLNKYSDKGINLSKEEIYSQLSASPLAPPKVAVNAASAAIEGIRKYDGKGEYYLSVNVGDGVRADFYGRPGSYEVVVGDKVVAEKRGRKLTETVEWEYGGSTYTFKRKTGLITRASVSKDGTPLHTHIL